MDQPGPFSELHLKNFPPYSSSSHSFSTNHPNPFHLTHSTRWSSTQRSVSTSHPLALPIVTPKLTRPCDHPNETGADRRAPDPGLQVEFEPTPAAAAQKPAEPYKPFQHSQQQAPVKKRDSSAALGKAARAKKAKAIERAEKTNQKFVVNKAKAERKKLMKS